MIHLRLLPICARVLTGGAIALLSAFTLLGCASGPMASSPTPSALPSAAPPSPIAQSTAPTAPPLVVQPPSRSVEELWALLRQELGVVVLFRHARAPGTGDPPAFRIDDCSTQRNLDAAGQQQARQLGEAFRQRQIPVARVLSSQWCRSLDTARLMDLAPVEPFPVLNSFFGDRTTEPQQTRALQQFILEQRNTPGVAVLVTHQVNITALTTLVPREGEAVLVRATPQGEIEVLGRI
ncbi:histidine phosphatase family protein [Thermoleptolyngbya sp. C42_A2020_037]|uniref:histidine phosphatase family protein n=1 Tax=Thermoleptolyngbya sp. C42_A2020_037 TaxID=2747799 RepID=UPI0025F118C5|nr:histidine phosphatase family protein [Thermoleptolyngbya sp. C42_A2020_037]